MKRIVKFSSALYIALGIAACALYRTLFATAVDDRNLLLRGTVPEIALWVLVAAAFAGAFLIARQSTVGAPSRLFRVVGTVVFAAGICTLLLVDPKGPKGLQIVYRAATYISIAALTASAIMVILGKKPFFLLQVCPCIMSILHLVECYQLWSEVPLLLDYVFGLGAVLFLMLLTYHEMASAAALPAKRGYCFSGLMSIFFCCCAAMQDNYPLFFAAAAVWSAAMMSDIQNAKE